MEITREPSTICRRPDAKFRVESSGAVIMRPRTGDFWACWGRPADNDYERFSTRAFPAVCPRALQGSGAPVSSARSSS